MGNLLYIIAVILIIAWAIMFLGYHTGGLIHWLLVIAVVAVLLRVIQGRKPIKYAHTQCVNGVRNHS